MRWTASSGESVMESSSRSPGEIIPSGSSRSRIQSSIGVQNDESNNTMGKCSTFLVWISVSGADSIWLLFYVALTAGPKHKPR